MALPERKVDLIGVASGLGGADAACAQAPARLAAAGLEEQLRRFGIEASWVATLAPKRHGGGMAGVVAMLCSELAARVAQSVRAGRLPCVIGGDHSCAVGTWSGAATALKPRGPLGLIWIDAHMDSHTPGTSPSGRPHGMPLAALLGQCDHALAGLEDGMLLPRHVCLVGVRSYEAAEAELLERLGVRVFGIEEVVRRGLAGTMVDATAIANEGTAGYGVTLDLDALDPREVPAVATPASFGIRGDELVREFERIGRDPKLVAFELAEYCPRLDHDGRSERLIGRLLCAALSGASKDSQVLADAFH
ncbi:MAG: arginase [Pseudomonadota bacterium]